VNDGARTRDNRNHKPELKAYFYVKNQVFKKLPSNFIRLNRAYPVVTHTKLKTPLSFQFAAKPAQHRSADAEN
jgi:hypothetical protein